MLWEKFPPLICTLLAAIMVLMHIQSEVNRRVDGAHFVCTCAGCWVEISFTVCESSRLGFATIAPDIAGCVFKLDVPTPNFVSGVGALSC